MQEVGNVRSGGCCAHVRNTASRGGSDDGQVRNDPAGTTASAASRGQDASHADLGRTRKTGFAEDDGADRSSDKLKDALLVSFIDWVSDNIKTPTGAGKTSISLDNKPVIGKNHSIVTAETTDRMASQITSNRAMSLLVQANVTQDTALHLLSVGALAVTIREPDQKQHTLFDADYMDVRAKTKIPHRPV